jgi:hypothetical protein
VKRPADIPQGAGTFAIVHTATKQAYVGYAKDLRQRASMWAYHLKMLEEKGADYRVPVRDFPRLPAAEWEFISLQLDEDQLRDKLAERGFRILNAKTRRRKTYVVQGIEDTLSGHARRLGVKAMPVYKRVERGDTPEQALGLAERYASDPREQRIAMMRVRIVTDEGGWVTYDEALRMRPELGDIRTKLQKLKKANPSLTEIKLREIPCELKK